MRKRSRSPTSKDFRKNAKGSLSDRVLAGKERSKAQHRKGKGKAEQRKEAICFLLIEKKWKLSAGPSVLFINLFTYSFSFCLFQIATKAVGLGWAPIFSFVSTACSCPRSPPFRTVRGLSFFLCRHLYSLYNFLCLLIVFTGMAPLSSSPPLRLALAWRLSPSIISLVGAWSTPKVQLTTIDVALALLSPTQLTTIEVGPGLGISSLPFLPLLLFFLPSGRPARGIQSDTDPKWSTSCYFSAGCCHGTVQRDLLYPSLSKKARAPSGRPPLAFSRSPLDSLLVGSYFSSSSLMLFLYLDDLLAFEMDQSPWWRQRVWCPSLAPRSLFIWRASGLLLDGTTLSSSHISFLHVLLLSPNILGGYCTHWGCFRDAYSMGATDCVSGFPPFGHLIYNGLAGPRYLLEKNIWEDSECWLAAWLVLCFTGFHQVLGWSSCLALSNQQAFGRPYCFTGRLRPIGNELSNGSMVLLLICTFLVGILALRVSRYRLAPVDCACAPLSPAKLPVSYPYSYPCLAPILTLPTFATYGVGLIC